MPLGISDIISIAKISEYLAQNDANKGSLFGPRIAPITAQILYVERTGIEYIYNLDPQNSTLTLTGNYLLSLCRGYNLRAQKILDENGGGSVSPINPATAPTPLQFEVGNDTLIFTGATYCAIPQFVGYNLLFVRGGVPQTTVNQGDGASYYSWDKNTGTFTMYPGGVLGELLQFYPI